MSTTIEVSEEVFEQLAQNKGDFDALFKKGSKIVKAKIRGADVLFTAGKVLIQGEGKIKESVVVGELASWGVGWLVGVAGSGLVTTGAALAGVAAAPAIAAVAGVVGTAFTLLYIWYDMDAWIAENAPLYWENAKEGTLLAYLESTNALSKLKTLVAEWEKKMIQSMTDFLYPKFEKSFIEYTEKYDTAKLGPLSDPTLNFIDQLLRAAGVPDTYLK